MKLYNKSKSVYIFRVGNLGDSLVILPALSKIFNAYNKKMILITNNEKKYISTWDVLKYTGFFSYYLMYDKKNLFSLISLVKKIRRDSKEKILFYMYPGRNIIHIIRDYIFFKICGFSKIYGIKESLRINTLRNVNKYERESYRYLREISKYLGQTYNKNVVELPLLNIPQDVEVKINDFLNKNKLKDKILIAIGFGGKTSAQKWGIDNYGKLMLDLSKQDSRINFILFGNQKEFMEGEILKNKIQDKVMNLAGKLSIIESAALLAKCTILISNDTGVMHLGASMGIKVFAIFSARNKKGEWEPIGENNVVFRKTVDCEECMKKICPKNNLCLKMIKVEEVLNAVLIYLASKK